MKSTDDAQPARYVHTPDMGEISGFGSGYEQACQDMLSAGVEWIMTHPDADPQFHGFEGIYGVCLEDNDDAKKLTRAIINASGGDATGAMHQAVVSRVLVIKKNGWDWYCAEVRKHEAEEASSVPNGNENV